MKSRAFIVARIFVEASDEQALALGERLAGRSDRRVAQRWVEPYWKEPSWRELTLVFECGGETPEAALEAVAVALGSGWSRGGSGSAAYAVWNPGPEASFTEAAVRFANLEIALRPPRRK